MSYEGYALGLRKRDCLELLGSPGSERRGWGDGLKTGEMRDFMLSVVGRSWAIQFQQPNMKSPAVFATTRLQRLHPLQSSFPFISPLIFHQFVTFSIALNGTVCLFYPSVYLKWGRTHLWHGRVECQYFLPFLPSNPHISLTHPSHSFQLILPSPHPPLPQHVSYHPFLLPPPPHTIRPFSHFYTSIHHSHPNPSPPMDYPHTSSLTSLFGQINHDMMLFFIMIST